MKRIGVPHLRQKGISVQIIVPVTLIFVFVLASIIFLLSFNRERNIALAGVNAAEAIAKQLVTLRSYYTTEIVKRVKKSGMEVDWRFEDRENTLPLPATFTRSLGEQIARDFPGTYVRLYSEYPFPHRAKTEKYDDFELFAMAALQKDPKTPVWRLEEYQGRKSIRYGIADQMKQSCVSCHNSHPESPKRDWKLGDVRGVIQVIAPVEELSASISIGTFQSILTICLGSALIIVFLFFILKRRVTSRLVQVKDLAQSIGAGRVMNHEMLEVDSTDELGELARSCNQMLTTLQQIGLRTDLIANGELQSQSNQAKICGDLGASVDKMSNNLYQLAFNAQDVVADVNSTANDLFQTAQHLESGATVQKSHVANVSQVISVLGDSTRQIITAFDVASEQAAKNAAVAMESKSVVQDTRLNLQSIGGTVAEVGDKMRSLVAASMNIQSIVHTIEEFTAEVSLLALNASIESARVGESGKGFSVIASEIQALAESSQTSAKEIKTIIADLNREVSLTYDLIEGSLTATQTSSQSSEQLQKVFEKIQDGAETTKRNLSQVAEACSKQSEVYEKASCSLGDISEVSSAVIDNSESINTQVEQLRFRIDTLQNALHQFRLSEKQ